MNLAIPDRVLILDRDGVINEDSDAYVKSLDEWIPIPGSIEAIARFSHSGYRIVVVTNQSGIARGLLTLNDLNAIHQYLRDLVASKGGRIEMIAFCPHSPDEDCQCRKPKAGLLDEIASRMKIDLAGVPFVGDALSDIEAALLVRATPWLVMTGKGQRTLKSIQNNQSSCSLRDFSIGKDLSAVAGILLSKQGYT